MGFLRMWRIHFKIYRIKEVKWRLPFKDPPNWEGLLWLLILWQIRYAALLRRSLPTEKYSNVCLNEWAIESLTLSICSKTLIHGETPLLCVAQRWTAAVASFLTIFSDKAKINNVTGNIMYKKWINSQLKFSQNNTFLVLNV